MNLFFADIQQRFAKAVDAERESALAKYHQQLDTAERITATATDLAYEALDSDDPAGNLAELGWTSGDVLDPYAGEPAEYLDSVVLKIIRDIRKGDATHKDAIQRLIRLGNRIAEATANSERCVAEAHSDVINSFLVED